ncbi:hypothetical protein C8Q80DRAFT_422726 [Daedaleopsis nitida]|nr:hypothetical protein C8Q80DRAFT_422726 [Daedaleopsis nitida]
MCKNNDDYDDDDESPTRHESSERVHCGESTLLCHTNLCPRPRMPGATRDTHTSRRTPRAGDRSRSPLMQHRPWRTGTGTITGTRTRTGDPGRAADAYDFARAPPLKVRRAILPNTLYLMPIRNLYVGVVCSGINSGMTGITYTCSPLSSSRIATGSACSIGGASSVCSVSCWDWGG